MSSKFSPPLSGSRLWAASDAIDDIVGVGNDVEIAIRSLLDVGRDSKSFADFQGLALGAIKLLRAEQIVGDVIREPWIGADIYVHAVGREPEPVQAAAVSADLCE